MDRNRHMATRTPTTTTNASAERRATADDVIGYRIMRETEIAPHWWARPVQIRDTQDPVEANEFCDGQNKVTMDPNRSKRQRYFAEAVYATDIADTANVLERFPAGAPRGSWPAEEFAAARRTEGLTVDVVMDLDTDAFLVVKAGA